MPEHIESMRIGDALQMYYDWPHFKVRIDAADNAYQALTEPQKALVSPELCKSLSEAKDHYQELKTE